MAQTQEHPDGSRDCGYEFIVPLKSDGYIDIDAFPAHKDECAARRFWVGFGERKGEFRCTRNRNWAFSYVPGDEDDEHLFHIETHIFRVGEYVSIRESDGKTDPFKVVAVSDAKERVAAADRK
ncbi:MAG: hypothetical protein EXQ91_09000 [Alphaproteobacteria bacterium]|nr:hypothetical protein [Alphaproteobacteria bacterium]